MNSSQDASPLLVTGAHRSGTTWVGKILAAGGDFTYVSEPLNCWHRPGVLSVPVEHWYLYICEHNEARYLPAFGRLLCLRYHPWEEFKSFRSLKDFARMARDWSAFSFGRLARRRPLLKDPFALFSAPWFAERLGCQVVVVVRHPAAFISSLKRLGWSFNFSDFLEQPLLMRDHLAPFRAEIEAAVRAPGDVFARGSLLWRIIYHVVDTYRQDHNRFHLLRHEDLSLDPHGGFQTLYRQLGLSFTPRAARAIHRTTSPRNPAELSRSATHSVYLDSRASLKNWKKRLTPEEVARVRTLTEPVASKFYADEDWE